MNLILHLGLWCSGITSALHAEGLGFKPRQVHFSQVKYSFGRLFHGILNECDWIQLVAAIAQLGERQTEDLEVPGSIPGLGILSC